MVLESCVCLHIFVNGSHDNVHGAIKLQILSLFFITCIRVVLNNLARYISHCYEKDTSMEEVKASKLFFL